MSSPQEILDEVVYDLKTLHKSMEALTKSNRLKATLATDRHQKGLNSGIAIASDIVAKRITEILEPVEGCGFP